MFFTTIAYLKFLFRSSNQHGVHSPFVFDFVTKGLYQKSEESIDFNAYPKLEYLSKKRIKILSKIINYFKIDNIYFEVANYKKASDKKYNFLFFNNIDKISELNLASLGSKQFIIIDGIYQNEKSEKAWRTFIKNKEVTVSINLFYFGLIFCRKEQAKEHFKIRT